MFAIGIHLPHISRKKRWRICNNISFKMMTFFLKTQWCHDCAAQFVLPLISTLLMVLRELVQTIWGNLTGKNWSHIIWIRRHWFFELDLLKKKLTKHSLKKQFLLFHKRNHALIWSNCKSHRCELKTLTDLPVVT